MIAVYGASALFLASAVLWMWNLAIARDEMLAIEEAFWANPQYSHSYESALPQISGDYDNAPFALDHDGEAA